MTDAKTYPYHWYKEAEYTHDANPPKDGWGVRIGVHSGVGGGAVKILDNDMIEVDAMHKWTDEHGRDRSIIYALTIRLSAIDAVGPEITEGGVIVIIHGQDRHILESYQDMQEILCCKNDYKLMRAIANS